MSAMEKMLASMLGLTPEKMRDMTQDAVRLMISLETRLKAIEDNQVKILALIEPKDGVNGYDEHDEYVAPLLIKDN